METSENSVLKRIIKFNKSIHENQDMLTKDEQKELIDILNDVADYGKSINTDMHTNEKLNKVFDMYLSSKRLSTETIDKIIKIKEDYNNYLNYVTNERAKLPTPAFTVRHTSPPHGIKYESPFGSVKKSILGGKTNKRKRKSRSKTNKRKSKKSKK